jgi:hypothetical protein
MDITIMLNEDEIKDALLTHLETRAVVRYARENITFSIKRNAGLRAIVTNGNEEPTHALKEEPKEELAIRKGRTKAQDLINKTLSE